MQKKNAIPNDLRAFCNISQINFLRVLDIPLEKVRKTVLTIYSHTNLLNNIELSKLTFNENF